MIFLGKMRVFAEHDRIALSVMIALYKKLK